MFWFRFGRPSCAKKRSRHAISLQPSQRGLFIEPLEERRLFVVFNTSITVAVSASTITYGQTVNLTATVSFAITGGTVTFEDGSTTLGTQSVNNGTATLSNVLLPAGVDAITASFSGYSSVPNSYGGSTATLGPSSIIETVAGSGSAAYSGDNAAATAASGQAHTNCRSRKALASGSSRSSRSSDDAWRRLVCRAFVSAG